MQFSWIPKVEYATSPDPQLSVAPNLPVMTPIKKEVSPPMEDFHTIVAAIERDRGYPMSPEQLAICQHIYEHNALDNVATSSKHMMIDSVAGSGKTSTLLMGLWFLPPHKKVLLLSFNKTVQQTLETEVRQTSAQIVKALGRHLPDCSTFTCHAHGLRSLRHRFGNSGALGGVASGGGGDNKYGAIKSAIQELQCDHLLKAWGWHMQSMLKLLMNLALDCSPEAQWSETFVVKTGKRYGVPIPARHKIRSSSRQSSTSRNRSDNDIYHDYMRVLRRAYEMCCQRQSHFDFTDMVYLPVRLNLPLSQYDVVLIDEAQDLNAIQMEMIARSARPETGHIIFVGDKNQAIYGFRGADTQAIDTITSRFHTIQFPLHICWRCPREVIALARTLVPYIRARPNARNGCTAKWSEDELLQKLYHRNQEQSHLILCRTNAPLIKLALTLTEHRIRCHVSADSLRDQLQKLLKMIVEQNWLRGDDLLERVEHYRSWKQKNLLDEGEELIEKNDQLDSLHTIVKSLYEPSISQTEKLISTLFSPPAISDSCGDVIKFETIHQCKGQEEDVVYLIRPSLLPHPFTVKSADTIETRWQLDQEENLRYVAITRAKQEFYEIQEEVHSHHHPGTYNYRSTRGTISCQDSRSNTTGRYRQSTLNFRK